MFNKHLGSIGASMLLDEDEANFSKNYHVYIAKKIGWPNYSRPPQTASHKIKKSGAERFSLNCFFRAFIT